MAPSSKQIIAELQKRAVPGKAEPMRAYLKSEMPSVGVRIPDARAIAKTLFGPSPRSSLKELERLAMPLWNDATYREERFVALNVLRLRPHLRLMSAEAAPMLEKLILSGAWWDLVDELSSHVVAAALENDPVGMGKVLRRWAKSDELWLKRAALVCQVVRGEDTDDELLAFAIEHAVDGKDFFLRKGIGWAMRSLAKHRPDVVRSWLKRWAERLSPLSVREAKKGLER